MYRTLAIYTHSSFLCSLFSLFFRSIHSCTRIHSHFLFHIQKHLYIYIYASRSNSHRHFTLTAAMRQHSLLSLKTSTYNIYIPWRFSWSRCISPPKTSISIFSMSFCQAITFLLNTISHRWFFKHCKISPFHQLH